MTFEEAMELLSGMFANLPTPVLSMVLESHSGNMERTVDYLIGLTPQEVAALQASARDLQVLEQLEQLDARMGGGGGAGGAPLGLPPPRMDGLEGFVPSLAPPGVEGGGGGGEDDDDDDNAALEAEVRRALAVSQRERGGRPAGAEEADFSRALEATQRALGDVPSEEADQEQSDAVLATMLQNQMLKQQLQEDRGFTAMLGGEGDGEGEGEGGGAPAAVPAPAAASSSSGGGGGGGWGEMLGLWGGEDDTAARGRAPEPAAAYQEGQGLFGALVSTGSWIGETLGLTESEQEEQQRQQQHAARAGGSGGGGGGEGVVRGGAGEPLARRRAPRPSDKKDD